MALEQFLNQVKEAWQNYELDLINYQNKCKLIKGWDDLFNKLKEHITSVSQMRLSPYYKVHWNYFHKCFFLKIFSFLLKYCLNYFFPGF